MRIRDWPWRLSMGIRNVCRFWRPVWYFHACDYSGMLELMEVAAREMRDLHRDHGVTSYRERTARQLTVVAELCRRLHEDNYFENAGYDPKTWGRHSDHKRSRIAKHSSEMAKWDAIYLGRMFRLVQHWWD